MKIEDLKKCKKIAILGYGKEGKSSYNFLLKAGINKDFITILDQSNGEDYLDNLESFDLIIKTPGISPYDVKILPHYDKIVTSTQLFFDNYKGRVIGVTATKGKSTTSTLLYETFKNAGYRVKLVGNIGNPVLDEIDILAGETYNYVIFELSSFMLEGAQISLYIGILGNIYPCHLDWHNDDFDTYKQAKLNLLTGAENIVIGEDFKELIEKKEEQEKYTFEKEFGDYFKEDDVLLKGEHNRKNISAVIKVCEIIRKAKHDSPWIFNKLIAALGESLNNFSGLPHRLENIGEYQGVTFIDDGISTTPESTIAAIKTFGSDIGTLMIGGEDSGFDKNSYIPLVELLKKYNIQNIVAFPDTGYDILEYFGEYSPNILKTRSMKEAVDFAFQNTEKGKICILSSAAPSFSVWNNYLEKCKEFKDGVECKEFKDEIERL